ncbi:MAG: hypothetical protein ACK41P_05750 [Asticcacaulis sp.]
MKTSLSRWLWVILFASLAVGCKPKPPAAASGIADSRTPSALAPEFYPPRGFVWSGVTLAGHDMRYGVAAPPVRPRGHVLILSPFGTPAEVSFELASRLMETGPKQSGGATVWLLDLPGSGGSARIEGDLPEDYYTQLAPKVLNGFIRDVIRPTEARPLTLVAWGDAADLALSPALQLPPQSRRILWQTRFSQDVGSGSGQKDWQRIPLNKPFRRADLTMAWQTANPDLRQPQPGPDHSQAMNDARPDLRQPAHLKRLNTPVLWILTPADPPAESRLCAQMSDCKALSLPAPGESDRALPAHLWQAEAPREALFDQAHAFRALGQ